VSRPALHVRPARGEVTSVVVVLHGGRAASTSATAMTNVAVLRMVPFARSLSRALGPSGTEVWSLRFGVRGWNGVLESPVSDAHWVLEQVRARHGDVPVVLVGHSMGGRTSLRVAGDRSVVGVVALAPWLPDTEPVRQVTGKEVVILHGVGDRRIPAAGSRAWAGRASGVAARLQRLELRGTGHAMLRRARLWHALASSHAAGMLAGTRTTSAGAANVPLRESVRI
jgi:pimeloyl-ACP methyl ester carboxylesterase